MYMIFWVLQRIIISIVLILCVHYIFIFLKTNLTVPKTRDLVNQPREKYKEIYEQINTNNKMSPSSTDSGSNADNSKMKNEFNWKTEISLKKGLEMTYNHYISKTLIKKF